MGQSQLKHNRLEIYDFDKTRIWTKQKNVKFIFKIKHPL